jgi:hypothetical protein
MKGYAMNAALIHLGKLIQMGTVKEDTNIEKLGSLLNEKLTQLKLPTLNESEVTSLMLTAKGFGLFKREDKSSGKHVNIV